MGKGTPIGAARAALIIGAIGLAAVPSAFAAPAGRKPISSSGSRVTRNATDQGAQSQSAGQHLRVYLAPRGGLEGLQAAVAAVSDPSSASYRQYLTPAQYRARFQASDASVAALKHWLRTKGLKPGKLDSSGRFLHVTGDAASAEAAFATKLRQYSKGGDTFQAAATTPSVPDSVASTVLAVTGLNTASHALHHNAPPPAGFANARPCSQYYGQVKALYQADFKTPLPAFQGKTLPYAPCGYVPAQLRLAYEGPNNVGDGAGQTVAITDAYAAPTIVQDANTYASNHGEPPFRANQFTQRVPSKFNRQGQCDPSGWYGEETLDVEAVHGMAPAANVRYYASASCFDDDFLDTLGSVVSENKASIVSNSWSDIEEAESAENVHAYEQVFLQGEMQGITFMFSSGDNGDEVANTGLKQVDYPSSDPYVLAVGGTSLGVNANGSYGFETGWGTNKYSLSANGKSWTPLGFLYGAGGGFSNLFPRPDYQAKVITNGSRALPDIGLDADPTTGMLIGETQTFPDGVRYGEYRIGGTSLSSPLMAGVEALAQQNAGGRLGFINPALYKAGKSRPQLFNDVSKPAPDAGNVRPDFVNGVDPSGGIGYSVRTFNQDSSLTIGPGWDDVTGFGSPNVKYIKNFG